MAEVRGGIIINGGDDTSNTSSCTTITILTAASERRNSHVPPGFRFHPTDEELINFYLRRKVVNLDIQQQLDVIPEIDLNKLEPWDLREKCKVDSSHQTEWYFFSHKDKKYPTGTRTNRATAAGFWKATGRDKAVHSNNNQRQRIGMRKTLVFYRGRAPHGRKTDWIMHEYRLEDTCTVDHSKSCTTTTATYNNNEDGWVVCRVFKKRNLQEKANNEHSNNPNLSDEESPANDTSEINQLAQTVVDYRPDFPSPVPHATLACKEEVMEEDSSVRQHTSQAPTYLQLPQLESSDQVALNINSSINEYSCKRHFTTNTNKDFTTSMNKCSEDCPAADIQECDSKPLFFLSESDDNLADLIFNNSQLTETWNLYASIARYHPDFCNFPSDLSPSLYLGRAQQPVEYPNSCEVDLWNFTR